MEKERRKATAPCSWPPLSRTMFLKRDMVVNQWVKWLSERVLRVLSGAPYFIPTFALLLLPFHLIINAEFYRYFYALIGFFTSYHVFSTLQEFGFHQTDITKTGKVFSCIFLVFANIVCYGYLIAFVIGGFNNGWLFLKNGFLGSTDWIMWTVNFVKEII